MNIHYISRPFRRYFRTKRMNAFSKLFGLSKNVHIVDIGGGEFNWELIPQEPRVTIVNIRGERFERGRFKHILGDATALEMNDANFDVAYSNSVIEHVGDWGKQMAFAGEVRRLAPRYYVQTPYHWFFVEPHYITPFVHWLPKTVQKKILRNFSIWGWITRPSQQYVEKMVEEIKLLDVQQMSELFPDAEIHQERFLGMTKSLIAVKT